MRLVCRQSSKFPFLPVARSLPQPVRSRLSRFENCVAGGIGCIFSNQWSNVPLRGQCVELDVVTNRSAIETTQSVPSDSTD